LRTRAICIKKSDFRETSQIIRFYTRDFGRINCVAKGIKRSKSPFYAPFDLFVIYDISFIEKRISSLNIVIDSDPLEALDLKKDISCFYGANYICDFVNEFTRENQTNPGLFELIINSLKNLEKGDLIDTLLNFEIKALKILGYLPFTLKCIFCKNDINTPFVYFTPSFTGIICRNCLPKRSRVLRVESGLLQLINRSLEQKNGRVTKIKVYRKIKDLLNLYINCILEMPLKTVRFVGKISSI
jgi:DNA repair protein RecO (recombination protein O)